MSKIITKLENHCLWITLNRPEVKNALDLEAFQLLLQAFKEALENSDVRCVVITGEGSAFTSGMDLSAMSPENTAAYAEKGEPHPALECIELLCKFDKPLLAAVNGIGVGLGFTLLLHCDKVFMSDNAKLKAPFVNLGVVPEAAASYLLPLTVGYKRAAEIMFKGDWISAEQAYLDSITDELCTPEDLLDAAKKEAELLCSKAPNSLRYTKRLMLDSYKKYALEAKLAEDKGFEELVGKEENIEAVMAFFEKREPKFH